MSIAAASSNSVACLQPEPSNLPNSSSRLRQERRPGAVASDAELRVVSLLEGLTNIELGTGMLASADRVRLPLCAQGWQCRTCSNSSRDPACSKQ